MPNPNLPTLPIVDLLSSKESPVDWLIPNFIPSGSLIALAGEPGAGKSFLAYTLGIGLATGTTTLGWNLQPKRILYFDQENSRPDCTQYLRWAWNGLYQPSLVLLKENFHLAHFALGSSTWVQVAAQYIDQAKPDLIIIDTTTPALNILDENDNGEASQAITSLRALQARMPLPPAIIALKHAKVRSEGGGHTLRGAKAWEGAVDSVVYQLRPPGHPRKDGLRSTRLEPSKTRAFGLRETVLIEPEWVNSGAGLKLARGSV